VGDTSAFGEEFTAAWLRDRFSTGHRESERPPWHEEDVPRDTVPAAVLVPVIQHADELTVLFTQRTAHLHDHPGQVAFPGGRSEAEDATPVATALREAEEEIGLARERVDVLGILPDYFTSTGFRVTPVVGLVAPPIELKLDAFEVADVFEAPLAFLLDPRNHHRRSLEFGGVLRQFWSMPFRGYHIWGATAGMVVSLHAFLLGTAR
jgi:8-oxo-dGTP pyrophosphatase MutT (NUDIX family)